MITIDGKEYDCLVVGRGEGSAKLAGNRVGAQTQQELAMMQTAELMRQLKTLLKDLDAITMKMNSPD